MLQEACNLGGIRCWSGAADEGDVPRWTGKAIWQTCDVAVDFNRRLVYPCSTFPWLLLWLAYRPHDECCSHRQECAADLVSDCSEVRQDVSDVLRTTAQTGTISLPLHQMMEDVSMLWEPDTEEVEGCNNILKHKKSSLPHPFPGNCFQIGWP